MRKISWQRYSWFGAISKYHDEQETVCGVSFVGFNICCVLQPQTLFLLVSIIIVLAQTFNIM